VAVAHLLPRGSLILVSLDPAVGREQGRTRTAVVVSRTVANRQALATDGIVTVVPITSSTERILSFQAPINAHGIRGKAQAEQVRAISVSRIVRLTGVLDAEQLAAVDEALLLHLGLDS